jgi:hypothetical protein
VKENNLEHFPPEDWVDLARDVAGAPKAARMRAHLEEGCGECKEAWTMWRLVLEVSSGEVSYRPAAWVVRAAKAAYPRDESWKWLKKISEFAHLIFDSFFQPLPGMVRASASGTRQLVHKADPYVIDIRLESDPLRGTRTFLTGQILNSERPEESPGLVEVVLLSGDRLLGKTMVSASGEFEMELGREDNVQLFISIRGQRAIGIDLPGLNS